LAQKAIAVEFLCFSELLYRSNISLFAFLTVIWQNLQYLSLRSFGIWIFQPLYLKIAACST